MNRDRAEGRTGACNLFASICPSAAAADAAQMFDFLAHVHNCPVCTPLVFTAPACWAINFDWLRETKWVRKREQGGTRPERRPMCTHVWACKNVMLICGLSRPAVDSGACK